MFFFIRLIFGRELPLIVDTIEQISPKNRKTSRKRVVSLLKQKFGILNKNLFRKKIYSFLKLCKNYPNE